MERMPLVSVLIPVYNAEKYLTEALNSIINQTYKNLEILIINDGSTDKSEKIILEFMNKDSRIRYIKQENQGVARTLRRGVELALGELIRRHDADDISLPFAIEEQVKFLQEHPDVGLVGTQQCHLTENSKIAPHKKLPRDEWFEGKSFKELSLTDFSSVHKALPLVHTTVMYKKKLVLDVVNYRPQFLVAEDYDLWLRILERQRIVVLHSCSYFVRIHGTSSTIRYKDYTRFYNSLAIEMARQRRSRGIDDIQLGKEINPPELAESEEAEENFPPGRRVRDDLSFMYSFVLDARDWKLIRNIAWQILQDGWRVPKTYKILIFPLLGQKIVKLGVRIKSFLRKLIKR